MSKDIDLAIIGAGIAGVSSAIYAKRAGLDFLLFETQNIGGQLMFMETIDNYVGLGQGVKGSVLAARLEKNLQDLGIEVKQEDILKVESAGEIVLTSSEARYKAKSLIIAAGSSFKKLGIEKEEEFTGRGVSYCAVCDGFFFKGKDVCVVGGGNSAVEEALYLSNIARKVYLIHRREQLRALDYLRQQAVKKENIEIVYNSVVHQIKGGKVLDQVILENVQSKELSSISVQGLFVAVGVFPNTSIFKDVVSLDESGFIVTDEYMRSSNFAIWACGDCRRRPLRQLITAASEGAIAAVSAYKFLKGQYISV